MVGRVGAVRGDPLIAHGAEIVARGAESRPREEDDDAQATGDDGEKNPTHRDTEPAHYRAQRQTMRAEQFLNPCTSCCTAGFAGQAAGKVNDFQPGGTGPIMRRSWRG